MSASMIRISHADNFASSLSAAVRVGVSPFVLAVSIRAISRRVWIRFHDSNNSSLAGAC